MSTTQIASLFASLSGHSVVLTNADGQSTYKIAKLSDKLGKLKDGSQGEYVILSREGNDEDIITIHPNQFKRLATKGEDNELKLIEATDKIPEVASVGTQLASTEPSTPAESEPAASPTTDSTPTEAAPAADGAKTEAAPAAPKEPSKKERAVAIFKSMTAEGKARKDIIAAMKTIGLTDAGAATYYQNIKSGAWK